MKAPEKKRRYSGSSRKARYAYSSARVHAMKVKLFPPETYTKMLMMALPELARFIEESEYKAEVDELARQHSGIDLIEFATHLNLARTFVQLTEMTMGEPHELIVEYLRRWDIREIKTILRGKQYGASEEEIIRVLVPSGELSLDFLQSLARKPSVDEVIAAVKGTMYYGVINDIDYSAFVMRMGGIVSSITGSSLYLRVVQMEIDVANLKTMFRLRNAGISGARALEYIIPNGLYLADQDIEKLVSAPFEEFVTLLN